MIIAQLIIKKQFAYKYKKQYSRRFLFTAFNSGISH